MFLDFCSFEIRLLWWTSEQYRDRAITRNSLASRLGSPLPGGDMPRGSNLVVYMNAVRLRRRVTKIFFCGAIYRLYIMFKTLGMMSMHHIWIVRHHSFQTRPDF